MPSAVSKANPVTYLSLDTEANIAQAIKAALNIGYTVDLVASPGTSPDPPSWFFTFTGPGNPNGVPAVKGDIVVWHPEAQYLESMTADRFAQLYTPQ